MMARCEVIGDATLYLGDCREIMPTLAPSNLLLTDPPYLLTSGGKRGEMRGIFDPANYANDGHIVRMCPLREWLPVAYAALTESADAYVMSNDKNLAEIMAEIESAGFCFHNLLVWDKRAAVANRWYMKNCEFIVYAWKGRAKTINDPSAKQLIVCPQCDESDHPTEKPVALMEHYIANSTRRGESVLDPFMGSGSTGVAAIKAERRFVGVELVDKHFETACRRIEAATRQSKFSFSEAAQ